MHNVPKWSDTLIILQHLPQDFYSVSDYFGTLCIKGLRLIEIKLFSENGETNLKNFMEVIIHNDFKDRMKAVEGIVALHVLEIHHYYMFCASLTLF